VVRPGELLRRITELIADRDSDRPLVGRLCSAYREITGAAGAALTVAYETPSRVTLCATDEVVARLEDLQDVLGEGPGHSATASGRTEVCTLPGPARSRWPIFAEAAHEFVESATIYAVPMRPEQQPFGVVTLYAGRGPDAGLSLEQPQLEFLANVVGAALLSERDAAIDDSFLGPWRSRATVHQATGMVVAQLHVGPEDALAVLRAHAYGQHATLLEVAEAVVDRRVRFTA
jgi:hypothetical protein